MKINWKRCRTYMEAQHYSRIVYLHEWRGKPLYWGKADNSFFGGTKRTRDGLLASGRYNPGYRHWIDGCLKHGGSRLYIGIPDEEVRRDVGELEKFLIHKYRSEMNSRVSSPTRQLQIEHEGEIPRSISSFPNSSSKALS
jgi:hypothetical protein